MKSSHVLLSHPSVPVRRLPDLVALARANPGKLSYGSSGIGSANHMAGELLNLLAKVNIKHVPYKGGADNVIAAASGETAVDPRQPGRIDGLHQERQAAGARSHGLAARDADPPGATLAEAGLPGYESTAWYGALAPAGVPRPVIGQLNALIVKAGQSGN